MVCNRCILVVRQELEKLKIVPEHVGLGEIILGNPPTEKLLSELAKNLGELGFEVLDNSKQKQIEKIRQVPQTIAFEVPDDEFEKFHQVYDLVHMMIIDKAVHPEELRLCELFALKFEYPLGVVKELVGTIKSNIENQNGVEETFKRINAYLKL